MDKVQNIHPFLSLLPELYRQDGDLIDLLGVLESFFLENEALIDRLPLELYDLANTPEEFLNFLGALVGLKNEHHLFTSQQMRVLIPKARKIQKKKGTRQALLQIVQLYLRELCGHFVWNALLEYEDWESAKMPKSVLQQFSGLYRSEKDVTLLLGPEPALQSKDEQVRLQYLASLYCPAVATVHVVVLPNAACTDMCSYLDCNAYLL